MTTATLARDIKQGIADDIRRVAVAHTRITLDVALSNWNYFFQQGRGAEARVWWAVAHELMIGGK
jgi:hypothetical protein